jgi:murein tripeptide amidase MpaA
MQIDAQFDAGNITPIQTSDPQNIQLAIRPDAGGEHMQWFYFRASGVRGQALRFKLVNAGKASYPGGWPGYQVVFSTDQVIWRRLAETTYETGVLSWQHTPDADVVWYAYFAPYALARHAQLIGRCQQDPQTTVHRLGATLDGRPLDLLQIGPQATDRLSLWFIARQHPGESMAEWWMEGFLERLLDPHDALARWLRQKATFWVVPNMNPDGSTRGHLRTNAAGANLNREWHAPTAERSPEVLYTLEKMKRTGVDFCLDVHGDEALPYAFIAGAAGIPKWGPRQSDLTEAFKAAYQVACPDFQTEYGYPVSPPGKANMSMCTKQIAERFDCLSMTLEMPFKDTANAPMPGEGFSPERAKNMGAAVLHPLARVLGNLR